jgi:hypothetical protein
MAFGRRNTLRFYIFIRTMYAQIAGFTNKKLTIYNQNFYKLVIQSRPFLGCKSRLHIEFPLHNKETEFSGTPGIQKFSPQILCLPYDRLNCRGF